MSERSRSIWVLGIHRSGTSAVAGALDHLGVHMGTMTHAEASAPDSNPVGQFEDAAGVDVMNQTVGNWRIPQKLLYTSPSLDAFRKYVADREEIHGLWGFKDPRMVFLWPAVWDVPQDPVIVYTVRDPVKAAASLVDRDGFPLMVAQPLIAEYWMGLYSALALTQKKGITMAAVEYPKLLKKPCTTLLKLCEEIGLQPSDEQLAAAVMHIDPTLCHHGDADVLP